MCVKSGHIETSLLEYRTAVVSLSVNTSDQSQIVSMNGSLDHQHLEPSFEDTRDFADVDRGHIASLSPCRITTSSGAVCWDNDAFSFLSNNQPCPPTANPKLWRQGQLNAKQGLYEVVPGIFQIRGFDLSVMTIVEGTEGIVIVDPLVSCECAAAGLELYQTHRGKGKREVRGLLYTHSHGDHYMGARGVLPEWKKGEEQKSTYEFPIVAPQGFMEAIMSESILAGPAMRQRAAYMYGRALERCPTGHIGVGLAMASSTGTTSLVPPNRLVQATGEQITVDGVRFVFQMVPDSEAPAEFNFYLPDFRALCMAETATNCLHNVVTLRGAQVRNAKAWAGYLDEALVMFGGKSDALFQSHHWPCWGKGEIQDRLGKQRDMYAYLHDQTVRMMNLGMTGIEIAEKIQIPPRLRKAWHTQGYYGSVSHNVKGVYQKYMTWFDGKPESLWKHPPVEEGRRYVDCMGGIERLCQKADGYFKEGDLRFACTLLSHARAAYPEDERVASSLIPVFEQLGYGAENATWRNFYLTAAQDLKTGKKVGMIAGGGVPLGPTLSVNQWFDVLSVQLNGELAAETTLTIDVYVKDIEQKWRLLVSNGVLTHRQLEAGNEDLETNGAVEGAPDLDIVMTKRELLEALRGKQLNGEKIEGRKEAFGDLLALTAVSKDSKRGPSQL